MGNETWGQIQGPTIFFIVGIVVVLSFAIWQFTGWGKKKDKYSPSGGIPTIRKVSEFESKKGTEVEKVKSFWSRGIWK